MAGKHRAPEPDKQTKVTAKPGKGQIRKDPKDPGFDHPSTFGKGWK